MERIARRFLAFFLTMVLLLSFGQLHAAQAFADPSKNGVLPDSPPSVSGLVNQGDTFELDWVTPERDGKVPDTLMEAGPENGLSEVSRDYTAKPEEEFVGQSSAELLNIDIQPLAMALNGDYEYTLSGANATITKYYGNASILAIPSTIDGYTVTAIGPSAFGGCSSLTNVSVPSSVIGIFYSAFENCASLKIATIPDSVTGMGDYVFDGCELLEKVTIGNNVPNLYRYVFRGCSSLHDVTIGEKVSFIEYGAFQNCTSLKSISLPRGLRSIDLADFYYSYTPGWGWGYTTSTGAFVGCTTLESISVDEGNLYFSSIDGVLLSTPSGLPYGFGIPGFTDLVDYSRLVMYPEGKADSEYSIPQKITTIRGSAFYQCKKLSSVVIPDSITEIGYSAFYQCNNLEQVVLSNNIKALRDTVFYNCTSLNNISIPDGVASIGYRTFYNCASLVSATIPDSVTSFDTGAFSGCDALTIRCNAGSAAHMYAIDNNIPYAFIGGAETFTVVFKDGNTVIETQSVEMFKDASAPRLKRPAYVLSWDKPFYYITGDLTVNAVWTPDPLFGKDVFVSVAVSGYHTLGLKSDGSLWVWGWSMLNGIGTTARPTFVMGNVSMIAAGDCNSMIVKMDGSLWVCGDDGVGAVGDGTTEIRDTFVKVMDDVIAISSGYRFSLAIKSDYTLWAWGFNENGELGDGTTVNKTRPVKILDNVESVSAGYNHSLAVKRDGTLVGWGDNSRGQIGNGKEGGNETRPVQVMNNVLSCSAAGRFSMAIKKDATLWGWGDNWDGQICGCYYWLGAVRRSTEELSPVKIMDDVSSVSAIGRTYLDSFRCTMAIKKDGSLWKWGGERGENAIPIRIGENTSQITGSEKSFALIRTDGSLWMWGGNVYGQLGDGTRESSGIPNKIDPGSSKTIETWGRNGVVRETREPESKVILAAIPNPGYWFEGWYESGAKIFGAEAVYSFNLAASRAMEARFLPLAVSSIDQNTTFAVQGTASDYLSFYSELPMVQTYISRENKIYVMNIDYYTTDNPASAEIFQYSPEMALLKKIVVSSGEPSFLPGAFVVDESGNIFVFYAKGANAYDEHNMMVVKYSPSGEELSRFSLNARPSDSYYGVRLPFNASGCRMEISGDYIAVYFGREMFVSGDGQNHQASYGFIINKNSMERLQGYSIPYVSHSMNQFILPLQNGAFLFADHGDGNPRAFAFEKIDPQNLNRNDKINSFVFKGNNGQNETLAEMGGLSKTSAGYIFAGTYDKSSGMDYIAGPRNLFVLIMNESLNVISQPVWLTNYGEFESACRPKIVRLGVDRFLLLWERVDNAKMDYRFTATGRKCETFAMMIDKDGNVLQPARKIQDDALTANDVLRYNPATQRVYWAVKNGDKSIKICSLDPEQVWGSGSSVMLGDVNGDGELDIGDVNLLYMYVRSKATLTGDALLAADVNDDGDIDIGDVNMLYMYIRGKIPSIG